jgi:hypothetical protein
MPAWKVLLIGALACACFALVAATLLAPMVATGGERWLWMGGLLVASACACAVFAVFLRHVSGSMDVKPRRVRD